MQNKITRQIDQKIKPEQAADKKRWTTPKLVELDAVQGALAIAGASNDGFTPNS